LGLSGATLAAALVAVVVGVDGVVVVNEDETTLPRLANRLNDARTPSTKVVDDAADDDAVDVDDDDDVVVDDVDVVGVVVEDAAGGICCAVAKQSRHRSNVKPDAVKTFFLALAT
jgi:hypothetical protein